MLTLRFLECKRASLYNDFNVRYSVAKEAGTMNIGEQIKARRIEIGMTQQQELSGSPDHRSDLRRVEYFFGYTIERRYGRGGEDSK